MGMGAELPPTDPHEILEVGRLGIAGPCPPPEERSDDHRGHRIGAMQRNLALQLVGQPDVVPVEERDQLSTGDGGAQVPAGAHTTIGSIRVVDDAGARTAVGRPPGDGSAPVGGAVVDEYQFPVVEGLTLHTLDGLGQKPLLVQEDDDG